MRDRILVSLVIIVVFFSIAVVASFSEYWFYLRYGFLFQTWMALGIGAIAATSVLALFRRGIKRKRGKAEGLLEGNN
ncbi:MAG: hypothetical protein ACE5Z5_07480 [Candidatus Bathyarchaeia archaeon]